MKPMTFSIRFMIAVGLFGVVMMVISACGGEVREAPSPISENDNPEEVVENSSPDYLVVNTVILPNGRTVVCVSDFGASGISCDWGRAG